jgi:hypothetical protein
MDPELQALIDALSGQGGQPGSSTIDVLLGDIDKNAKVFGGSRSVRQQLNYGADPNDPYTPQDSLYGGTETINSERTIGDLAGSFFKLSGDKLRDLQQDLFIGGFYGNADPDKIAWGAEGDDVSYGAWLKAVARAQKYYAAGRNLTVEDVIKMAGEQSGKSLADGGGEKPTTNVRLQDPAALGLMLDATSQKVLGRKANPEEKRLFLAAMRSAEISQGQQQHNAPTGALNVMQDVDPEAQAVVAARNADPVRADAREVVGVFDTIAKMFKTPGG